MNIVVGHRFSWLLLGLLIGSGCGPGVGEGPRPLPPPADGPVLDSSREAGVDASAKADAYSNAAETTVAPISPPYSCIAPEAIISTVYRASQLGSTVRLITMGENTLLAEKTVNDIVEPLLVFMDWGSADASAVEKGRATLSQTPLASLQPIGVVNRRDGAFGVEWPFDYDAFVLARGPAGNALYGANLPTDGLSELVLVADSQVPADVELRGLVYLPDKMVAVDDSIASDARFKRLCLFGDGLYCLSYDGSVWSRKVEVEAASGSPFNSVAVWNNGEGWFLVAVGDQGRIAKVSMETQSTVQELTVDTSSNILTISSSGTRLAAAGENGTVVYIDGRTDESTVCNLFDQTIVSFKWWGARLRGIERNGELFEVTFGGCRACAYGISVGSARYGRLIGIGGDFLLLNQESILLVTANVEPVVMR
jgi:hypothetical protein